MLDDNGFIDNGNIIFNDEELADTCVPKGAHGALDSGACIQEAEQIFLARIRRGHL